MPSRFDPNNIGELDDSVRLVIGGFDVLIAESWEVKSSILTQPSSWNMRLGYGGEVAILLRTYPPNTPFQLFIGPALQQTGTIDSPGSTEAAGGTEFTLRGRDSLAPMHDDLIDAERQFDEATYKDLARKQLDEVGLKDRVLHTSNRANRNIRSGIPLLELAPVRSVDEILTNAGAQGSTGGIVHQQINARLGERRYEFLRRYLDMAGLFLWAAADGSFVLSEPNAQQKPATRILRTLNQSREDTNIKQAFYENSTEGRYTTYSVYGRGAGKKNSHAKALGEFVDREMLDWGFTKSKTIRAATVRTADQAHFLARRHCAEDRRNGFKYRYVMSGHSAPALVGTGRYVWCPDTIVEVDDKLLGIEGLFYVSDVVFRRSPQTETEITLIRPEDLVYGPTEFQSASKAGKANNLGDVRTVRQILEARK